VYSWYVYYIMILFIWQLITEVKEIYGIDIKALSKICGAVEQLQKLAVKKVKDQRVRKEMNSMVETYLGRIQTSDDEDSIKGSKRDGCYSVVY
jgi:hypothetical protein